MITTIQIHENVKKSLDALKSGNETYEEVIVELMQTAEQNRRKQKSLLAEGYFEMAKESLKITKEWSSTDKDWD